MNTGMKFFGTLLGAALALAASSRAGIPTPRLHVEGNAIKDTAGNTVVLRGVSMIHAGWPYAYGAGTSGANTTLKNFLKITDTAGGWYSRVVRMPVADSLGSTYLFPLEGTTAEKDKWVATHLQPSIDSAKARGVYVILDYHLIEDITPQKIDRCNRFWTYMAPKFANEDHVLYEVFNEPVKTPAGDTKWSSLKPTSQAWVNLIRTYAPKTIVLVSSPNWTSNLAGINNDSITGGNIVYVAHMYPQNDVSGIEAAASTVLAKHPVIFSEWGYDTTDAAGIPTKGTTTGYAVPFREWARSKGVSWTAWCWSGSWAPTMLLSDRSADALTPFGQFAKDWLQAQKNDNVPSGSYVPPATDTGHHLATDSLVFTTFDTPYHQNPRQTDLAARLGVSGGGWWYVGHDDSGSTVKNDAGMDVTSDTAALSAGVASGALHLKLTTSSAQMTYPYAFLQTTFTGENTYFDLRKLKKVVLRLKGAVVDGTLRIYFTTLDVKRAKDWGNYGISTDLSATWTDVEIQASDLTPTPWSAAATGGWTWADSGAVNVNGLGFSVGNKTDADLWIDRITFYGLDSSTFSKGSSGLERHHETNIDAIGILRRGGSLAATYSLASAGAVEIRLVDLRGKSLWSTSLVQGPGSHSIELPAALGQAAILQIRSASSRASRTILP